MELGRMRLVAVASLETVKQRADCDRKDHMRSRAVYAGCGDLV